MPVSYVVEHAARLDSLEAQELRSTADKWLAPNKRCVVVVGDAAKIAPAITSLGIGRVELTRGAQR